MQKTSGTTVLDQDRDHNHANEIDTDDVHGDADNPITGIPGTRTDIGILGKIQGLGRVSFSDRVEYKYNRQGELIELKDQNETLHQYTLDKLGRMTTDAIDAETLSEDLDDAVLRIERTYDVRGLLAEVTSYNAESSGDVVNQIVREYNDLQMLDKEYQEHEGAKDGSTLYVQYNYDDTDSSGELTKGMRLKSVRHPNARLVHYTYGSSGSDADNLNRLDAIKDDDGTEQAPLTVLSQYTYIGLGTIVIEDFQQPDVKLDYYVDDEGTGTSGTYEGFDNFDRVVNQKWIDYGPNPDQIRDQYTYGYDRASNRNYRENTGSSGKDEYYTYDGMHRLEDFDRGDLNEGETGIDGTPAREETFWLDATGNWAAYNQKTSGATTLAQLRTHNKANETTEIIKILLGDDWVDPVHDAAGNMTTAPKPSSLTDGLTLKYDAWNRLAEVKDDEAEVTVANYEYDGLNRRIKKHIDSQSPDSPNGVDRYEHFYYNSSWQTLETRKTTSENAEPEDQENADLQYQYIWSARYIDSPVLRDEDEDDDGDCDDERLYYLADANMNVTCLIDTGGEAVERYLYDPYGKVTIYTADWSSTRSSSLYANPYLYTGREHDPETGLYYYRNRYYHAQLGRFVSRDPIGYRGGINLYGYAGDSPTRKADPFGLWPQIFKCDVCCVGSFAARLENVYHGDDPGKRFRIGIDFMLFFLLAPDGVVSHKGFLTEYRCARSCCEFRQRVSGHTIINGVKQAARTTGGLLIPDPPDSVDDGYTCADDRSPDPYLIKIHDTPSLEFVGPPHHLDLEYHFEGRIHDVCRGRRERDPGQYNAEFPGPIVLSIFYGFTSRGVGSNVKEPKGPEDVFPREVAPYGFNDPGETIFF